LSQILAQARISRRNLNRTSCGFLVAQKDKRKTSGDHLARAGNSSCRYGPLIEVAWFHDNAGGTPHPVGEKKPNGFGLYDTLGNVWEWVQDWYGVDYYSHSPESDPKGPDSGEYRVSRGGSWRGIARGLARVSSRYSLKPSVRSIVVGFRCAREVVV
jgi:formylglycine-generating enzyme required for sulfatase activity